MIDGETEGFMNTAIKAMVGMIGAPGKWGTNLAKTAGATFLATTGVGTKEGTKLMQDAGFDAGAFFNMRRAAAGFLVSLGLGALTTLLQGLKDDDKDDPEEGNPWKKIKKGTIKDKGAKEVIDQLAESWENGVELDFNYAQLFYEHPELVTQNEEGAETLQLLKKFSKMYEEGKNRSIKDQKIDKLGLAIYFLTRMKRDNDAFINIAGLFNQDSSSRQEIQGMSSLLKSTISAGMTLQFASILREVYGDARYGSLHDSQMNYIDKYNTFVKQCKKNGYKPPKSLKEFTDLMVAYYEQSGGGILIPDFKDNADFISFLSEHKEDYPDIETLNKKLFNDYFFANSSRGDFYKKGDAKWRRHLLTITPWLKSQYLLYNPEETLESYMFAVRNQ
jgi:hypothetical protein